MGFIMEVDRYTNSATTNGPRLSNITLVMTTEFYAPYTERNFDAKTNMTTYSGMFFEMMNIFAKDLGFRYEVVEPPDGQWGVELENGYFTGMIGLLQRGEVDIGVGAFTETPERRLVVDFFQPLWEEPITYIMSANPSSTMDSSFKPLTVMVWLLCLVSAISFALILWIMNLPWSSTSLNRGSFCKGFGLNFFSISVSALKQPLERYPKRGSMRIAMVTWWLCTLIISVAYSANLVAILSVEVESYPVNSLQELSTQSDIRTGATEGTALESTLQRSKIPLYNKLGETMDEWLTGDVQDIIDNRVANGDIIVLGEKSWLKDLRAYSPHACKLALGKDGFNVQNIGFPVRKTFPYKDEFNRKILQFIQSGILNNWIERFSPKAPLCSKASGQAESASLIDIFGAILILVIGVILSVIAIVIECTSYQYLT